MKFFELINEVVYDIVGYIIPGMFILLLLYISINSNNCNLITYNFLINIRNINLYENIVNFKKTNFPFILMLSYILGHIPKAIFNLNYFKKVINCLTKKINREIDDKFDYLKDLEKNITVDFKDKIQINFSNDENYKKFLLTYASTTSRFKKHNNLIQKYIAKSNFYLSFSIIFFLIFVESIISLIIYLIINRNSISIRLLIVFLILSFLFWILFKGFYFEFFRHQKLRYKESLLFLYNLEKSKMN